MSRRRHMIWRGLIGSCLTLLALACDPTAPPLAKRLAQAERERDSLRQKLAASQDESAAHERYIADTTKDLNEVQDAIDGVRHDLQLVHVSLLPSGEGEKPGETQDQAILEDIANIRRAVGANLGRLAQIERSYRGSAAEVALLRALVGKLQARIAEQQDELAEMEQKVHQLQGDLASSRQEIHDKQAELEREQSKVEEFREQARTGYLLVGSPSKLQQLDLIELLRSGFMGLRRSWRLKKQAFDQSKFHAVDISQIEVISLGSSPGHLEVLTPQPPSTYQFERDESGAAALRITEPRGFWQFRYVVVLVGP